MITELTIKIIGIMVNVQGGVEMPLKESDLSKMPVISAEHVLRSLIIINISIYIISNVIIIPINFE